MLKYRHRVLAFLMAAGVITYLDRIAISLVGPRIQADLGLSPAEWGWVVGVFQISYGLFEIPSGHWSDRLGPRRVLTRIVLTWSAFTAMTGLATNYYFLLFTRFCFGAGEAGALPNFGICLSRWFPPVERARAMGCILMASQVGSALAPFLVLPLQARYGWRVPFLVLGVMGALWCIPWYLWYRDRPEEMPAVSAEERAEIGVTPPIAHLPIPWRAAARNSTVQAILLLAFCYFFAMYFFLSWLHSFLVKARGFTESELLLSALPPIMAACGNVSGGYLSDRLAKRVGLKWGRRAIGVGALSVASLAMALVVVTPGKLATVALLGLVYAAITLQQTCVITVVVDIGGKHVGAIVGAMNMAAQAGGFVFSVAFGYLVTYLESYDLALLPLAGMLAIGALAWLRVDATERIAEG
ncbi:MAG: MFS transporter [Bryobacteraceae bacterium]|nr:MFS transporter [Bryobacteraceae bacterium]